VIFYVSTFLLLPVSSFLPLFYHMSTAIEVIFDFDLICGKKLLLLLLLLLLLFHYPSLFYSRLKPSFSEYPSHRSLLFLFQG